MKKAILVGTVHGTKECPKVFIDIVNKECPDSIAIEFYETHQKMINLFLAGKIELSKLRFLYPRKPHDGRAGEVRTILKSLRDRKIPVKLIDSDDDRRDANMAKQIKQMNGTVAVYCGNMHASKIPIRIGKKKVITMGSMLPINKTTSYYIKSLKGGEIYSNNRVKVKPDTGKSKIKLGPSEKRRYDYTITVEKFTPNA